MVCRMFDVDGSQESVGSRLVYPIRFDGVRRQNGNSNDGILNKLNMIVIYSHIVMIVVIMILIMNMRIVAIKAMMLI